MKAEDLEYVDFIYTHPKYILDLNYSIIPGNENIWLTNIAIMDNEDLDNPERIFLHSAQITVPPILLGHEVWSDISSLAKLEQFLNNQGFDKNQVIKAWRTDGTAAENQFIQDAAIIPDYIERLRLQALGAKVSSGKVNVIVHSRGGLYTRAYIEEIAPGITYNDDINSLITLNTPHSGSQFANLVLDQREIIPSITLVVPPSTPYGIPINNLDGIQTFETSPLRFSDVMTKAPFISKAEAVELNGAKVLAVVKDNLSGSAGSETAFIANLNKPENLKKIEGIPVHAVATNFKMCDLGSLACNGFPDELFIPETDFMTTSPKVNKLIKKSFWPLRLYNAIQFVLNKVPGKTDEVVSLVFNGETGDLIVPTSSMRAGLAPQYMSTFADDNIAHIDLDFVPDAWKYAGVTNSRSVDTRIFELLKQNVHDSGTSNFTKDGYNPPALEYSFLKDESFQISSPKLAQKKQNNSTSASKIYVDPLSFPENIRIDDEITFDVYQENIDRIMVTYDEFTSEVMLYEEIEGPEFKNEFTFKIPEELYGKMMITASGYNDQGLTAEGTFEVFIAAKEGMTLESIRFENEQITLLEQNEFNYTVLGTFSDGIERVLDKANLTVSIDNEEVVSVAGDDDEVIKANKIGNTYVTVAIDALNTQMRVGVIDNELLSSTLLSDFNLTANAENEVNVTWETFMEYQSETFVLESSVGNQNNFSEINSQPGKGTTNDSSLYSYTDSSVGNAIVYYRLMIIDTAGNSTYSNIFEIDLRTLSTNPIDSAESSSLQFYPNPVSASGGILTLSSKLPLHEGTINLYSLTGKLLSVQEIKLVKGANKIEVNISDKIVKGTYLMVIKTASYAKTIKVSINR